MDCLSIGCLNVRSLLPSLSNVKKLLQKHEFDILLLCETWLYHYNSDDLLKINNYMLYRGDRNARGAYM